MERVSVGCLRPKIGVQVLVQLWILIDVDPLACPAIKAAELFRKETWYMNGQLLHQNLAAIGALTKLYCQQLMFVKENFTIIYTNHFKTRDGSNRILIKS